MAALRAAPGSDDRDTGAAVKRVAGRLAADELLAGPTRDLVRGHIVEDKRDAVFLAAVDHAVRLLVVDFIGVAHLKAKRLAVDRESHPVVRRNRNVNPVAVAE